MASGYLGKSAWQRWSDARFEWLLKHRGSKINGMNRGRRYLRRALNDGPRAQNLPLVARTLMRGGCDLGSRTSGRLDGGRRGKRKPLASKARGPRAM